MVGVVSVCMRGTVHSNVFVATEVTFKVTIYVPLYDRASSLKLSQYSQTKLPSAAIKINIAAEAFMQ